MQHRGLTIRAQLTLAFGTLVLLLVAASGLGLYAADKAHEEMEDFIHGSNARDTLAEEVQVAVERRAIAARNLLLVDTAADRDEEYGVVVKAHEEVQKRIADLLARMSDDGVTAEAKALAADIAKVEAQYGPVALSIVDLARKGQTEEATAKLTRECRPLLKALIQKVDAFGEASHKASLEAIAASEADFARLRNLLIGLSIMGTVVACMVAWVVVRHLTRALGAEPAELNLAAQRVAEGDLTTMPILQTAPAGSVLAYMATMQASLVEIVSRVRGASDSIATGAEQIAVGGMELSQRTEEQASALEETAATMEEFTGSARRSTESAGHANELAKTASTVAGRGGDEVSAVVNTMRGINESSRRINDIISVIDGIAFQTNILALNAAVEAARAGEQGRGFAVVASEVRSLAGRSAEAAKEIKTLISASVHQVEEGSSLVERAGITMQEVVDAVKRVGDIVGEISHTSFEQDQAISQIGEALNQLDKTTQQNAALVEESAAASQNLQHQTQELVDTVAIFKLDAERGLKHAHRTVSNLRLGMA